MADAPPDPLLERLLAADPASGSARERRAPDRWAVDALHGEAIARYVARRVDRDAADAVVAEVFAVARRRLPQHGEPPDWLLTWLYGVARRTIHAHGRRRARRTRLLSRLAGQHEPVGTPDTAELLVGDPQLARAFALLSAHEREAIALVAWEPLNAPDAARLAGCSNATFAVRYSRARTKLAATLGAPESTHPVAAGNRGAGDRRTDSVRCLPPP